MFSGSKGSQTPTPPRRRPSQLRAVVYGRVSTAKRSQEASVPRQLAELRAWCKRKRWTVIASESDRMSGGRDDRPGLQRALEHVRRGRADVLAVHDIDRLGRDVRAMLANVDGIHAAGGNLLVLDRAIDTSVPEGRLFFTIVAAIAEYQRRDLVRKVLAGLEHARKKGARLGRPLAIFGPALDRAVALRRQRPRPSWSEICHQLKRERLGTYARGTLAGAVGRCLKTPSKSIPRNTEKTARSAQSRRAA